MSFSMLRKRAEAREREAIENGWQLGARAKESGEKQQEINILHFIGLVYNAYILPLLCKLENHTKTWNSTIDPFKY